MYNVNKVVLTIFGGFVIISGRQHLLLLLMSNYLSFVKRYASFN